MEITYIINTLRWDVKNDYLELFKKDINNNLADNLGVFLAKLKNQIPELGERVIAAISALPDSSLSRILGAPETVNKILWPSAHDLSFIGRFLENSCYAEMQLLTSNYCRGSLESKPQEFCYWTALNDVWVEMDGSIVNQPICSHQFPINFDSPFEMNFGLNSRLDLNNQRLQIGHKEKKRILNLVELAMDDIALTNSITYTFVKQFTGELAIYRSLHSTDKFLSRSPQRYPGRSIFRNPHHPDTDIIDIAEGLIHEAIHTLLDFDEIDHRSPSSPNGGWIINPELCDGKSRVISPWTGRSLDIQAYLHACFVWFGLLHFWSIALSKETFSRPRVRGRILSAALGFLSESLLAQLQNYRDSILEEILLGIEHMQSCVRSAFIE